MIKFLTRRLKMEIEGAPVWIVIAVISISLFLFWSGALVYAYLVDDVIPAPVSERSVPAPQSY